MDNIFSTLIRSSSQPFFHNFSIHSSHSPLLIRISFVKHKQQTSTTQQQQQQKAEGNQIMSQHHCHLQTLKKNSRASLTFNCGTNYAWRTTGNTFKLCKNSFPLSCVETCKISSWRNANVVRVWWETTQNYMQYRFFDESSPWALFPLHIVSSVVECWKQKELWAWKGSSLEK